MPPTLARATPAQRGAALARPSAAAAAASTSGHHRGARPAPGPRMPAIAHPRRLAGPADSPATHKRSDTTLPPPASFFGVGAPEAILVGIVALIVFGPKGLAEAVKSVGKTLRAFQPTIRELASVSSELRSTLEEQIGLDEIRAEITSAVSPLPPPATTPGVAGGGGAAAAEEGAPAAAAAAAPASSSLADAVSSMQAGLDPAAAVDPDIAAKRAAAAAAAWGGAAPVAAAAAAPAPAPAEDDSLLGDIPLADLEAELARRRGQA